MILVKPSFEILTPIDGLSILKNIERAGRTCYKSEGKITDDSAIKFCKSLIKSGHESVIEHESISVKFIVDRGVSHELVRHRLASYSQESTRYCKYCLGHVTFVIPNWLKEIQEGIYLGGEEYKIKTHGRKSRPDLLWAASMNYIEDRYHILIDHYSWSPQKARSILPNSLKTEIVMTANIREWRHVLNLRTSPKAHPQMQEIMIPLLKEFSYKIPVLFDDLFEWGKDDD
ncbi:MAG TPA: FAD-dependent thymidylate synthase [bacterium]|nr:FAD-dependent thymidylate synthase [bacterium]